MINPNTEDLIPIYEARSEFPQKPSTATLWRWMLKGVRGAKLDSIRIGGRRFTSKEACLRFIAESSAEAEKPVRRTRRQNEQALENAKAILDEFGI